MNRRLFFKNLIGASAAVAIGPRLFDQLADHEYGPHSGSTLPPPETIFSDEGFWAFHNDKLIAWSNLHGVVLSLHAEPIEVTADPKFFPDQFHGYREYSPGYGPIESRWQVQNLHVIGKEDILSLEPITIILKSNKFGTYKGQGYLTNMSGNISLGEEYTISAEFKGYEELMKLL
jgi:hypothetical protein